MICARDGKGGATVSSKIKDDFNESLPHPAKNIKKRKKSVGGGEGRGLPQRSRLNSRHKGVTVSQKLYVIYLY